MSLSPIRRRVLQAILYEAIGVLIVGPVLATLFDASLMTSVFLAAVMSGLALGWNYLFNMMFEAWEARQIVRGRSWQRRLCHGIGFEGGLTLMLVPIAAWWLDTTLLNAFLAELGLLAFFFVYAIGFTWAFDRIFGLPLSAAPP